MDIYRIQDGKPTRHWDVVKRNAGNIFKLVFACRTQVKKAASKINWKPLKITIESKPGFL